MSTILPRWEMLLRVIMTLVMRKKGLGMSQVRLHMENVTQSFLTTYQIVTERATLNKLHKWIAIPIELKELISQARRMFIAPFRLNHLTKSNLNFMLTLMPKMRVLHLDLCLSFRLILMSLMKHVGALLKPQKKYLNVKFLVWTKRTQRVMMNMLS